MPLSVQFPMISGLYGFESYADDQTSLAINQNLKFLLLTNPGELQNDINFGVGLHMKLFEMNNETTRSEISQRIRSQVIRYMPYVVISSIDFDSSEIDSGALGIGIRYSVNQGLKQEYMHLHVNV